MELNIKVGDKVAQYRRGIFVGSEIVKKITPTGIIKTADGLSYRPDGNLKTTSTWSFGRIEPWTDNHDRIIERSEIIQYLDNFMNIRKLSLEQLKELKDWFDKKKENRHDPS